jgi:AraC-like DNA-binding protein/quercetin dioxygenase-like cupin family protein
MSSDGQTGGALPPPAVAVGTFPLRRDRGFAAHTHAVHQLAWASAGALHVRTGDASWILPSTLALWIPAGLRHEVAATTPAVMVAAYLSAPVPTLAVDRATAVRADALLVALLARLGAGGLDDGARRRAEAVLVDVLAPVADAAVELRVPRDPRAAEVAAAIVDDPADTRTLAAWGRLTGASARTLARAFVTETGLSFGRWRTAARVQAGAVLIAEGRPVTEVGATLGYATPSAFIAAFRRATGTTPGAYRRPAPTPPITRRHGDRGYWGDDRPQRHRR